MLLWIVWLYICTVVLRDYRTARTSCDELHSWTGMEFRKVPYQYVHDQFRQRGFTIGKFNSTDPSYVPIPYEVKQNVVWNHRSVCVNDTFVLLLYFVNRNDTWRRGVIRKHVKQGMVVEGKRINYVFVVASPLRSTKSIKALEKENSVHSDILISIHEDSFSNVTLSVLDAFMWVRDYCKEPAYVVRIDGDAWVHFGNLIHYLETAPRESLYAGHISYIRLRRGWKSKGIRLFPLDYPVRKWVYVWGGANLLSRDLIPYINIGTLYMDVIIPHSEDLLIGEIMRRAGVIPCGNAPGYELFSDYKWLKGGRIPSNAIFVHRLKRMRLFRRVYERISFS